MAQPAYTGPRFKRRQHWISVLVKEHGGPKAVAAAIGSVDTHITAMCKGNRGVGDELADRLEKRFGKPDGWLDQPINGALPTTATDTASLLAWGRLIESAPPRIRKSAVEMLGTFFSDPGLNEELAGLIAKRLSGEAFDSQEAAAMTGTNG